MLRTGVVDNGNAVLRFATAVVVFALAIAYAAQIGQVAMEAELAEGFGGGLDDFVGMISGLSMSVSLFVFSDGLKRFTDKKSCRCFDCWLSNQQASV